MKKIITVITGLALVFTAASCRKNTLRGEGDTITDKRTVSQFETVETDGSTDVTIYAANENKVEVTGYENLVPAYESNVSGGKLKLKFKDKYINVRNSNIHVTVYTTHMNDLRLNGSGNITVGSDLSSSSMSAEINGSGNITIGKNKFENFTCKVNGSGEIKARNAEAENVEARISGSGNIEVTATRKINVNISGSGNVDYWGDAVPGTINISGSGNIKKH
jgi:predicted small secreted protein